jgi:hypothetical protein
VPSPKSWKDVDVTCVIIEKAFTQVTCQVQENYDFFYQFSSLKKHDLLNNYKAINVFTKFSARAGKYDCGENFQEAVKDNTLFAFGINGRF